MGIIFNLMILGQISKENLELTMIGFGLLTVFILLFIKAYTLPSKKIHKDKMAKINIDQKGNENIDNLSEEKEEQSPGIMKEKNENMDDCEYFVKLNLRRFVCLIIIIYNIICLWAAINHATPCKNILEKEYSIIIYILLVASLFDVLLIAFYSGKFDATKVSMFLLSYNLLFDLIAIFLIILQTCLPNLIFPIIGGMLVAAYGANAILFTHKVLKINSPSDGEVW